MLQAGRVPPKLMSLMLYLGRVANDDSQAYRSELPLEDLAS